MAGALRKTMLYLGLAEDRGEEYVDIDDYEEVEAPMAPERDAQVTPLHRSTPREASSLPLPRAATTAAPDLRRISTIHPRSYNDARKIGEAFRSGIPVIMNLTDMNDADAKRLVDFAAGIVFGLHGAIERVTNRVFLLSPAHVTIAGEGTSGPAAAAAGLFDQS